MAEKTKDLIRLEAAGLDLEVVLLGGQSFSWRPGPGAGRYTGVAGSRAARVWMEGNGLLIQKLDGAPPTGADADFWRHYFALDADYAALHRRFAASPELAACLACAPGIRVLHQPFFETLLAFIISQNNHIPRITGIVQRLRQGFGPALAGGEHGFPVPAALAGLEPRDLEPLRAGFRAKYLIDAARKVAAGVVDEAELRTLPTAEARQRLMLITGVGPKVADCVLLFSLERNEVAPMDVWMKKAVERHFGGQLPACAAGAEGIAQQYIFAWARQNLPRGG